MLNLAMTVLPATSSQQSTTAEMLLFSFTYQKSRRSLLKVAGTTVLTVPITTAPGRQENVLTLLPQVTAALMA